MPDPSRSEHLDNVLTGLAMYDAWQGRDNDRLTQMVHAVPAEEAVTSLLSAMEVMCSIFAVQIGTSAETVIDSVRRRIVRELGTTDNAR